MLVPMMMAFLALMVNLTMGCAIVSSFYGPKVLEKSKEQTPPWVSVKPSQLMVQENGFQYHAVQLDEMDLPLGVKKAQLGATQLCEMAIVDAARIKTREVCKLPPKSEKAEKSSSADRLDRIDGAVADAVKREFGGAIRVADIYYEKVEAPEAGDEKIVRAGHVYNIHVLVTFPQEQYNAALAAAGKTLRRESGVESRRCGEALTALPGLPSSR